MYMCLQYITYTDRKVGLGGSVWKSLLGCFMLAVMSVGGWWVDERKGRSDGLENQVN